MSRVPAFHAWIAENLQQLHSQLPGFFILEGPAGSGKTTLIMQWLATLTSDDPYPIRPAQRHFLPAEIPAPSLLAHHFTARSSETPAQMSRRLIEELGHHPLARSASDLWSEAIFHLHTDGVRLLIIDQAERLSLLLCLYLQDYLLDQRECPLLLVGTPPLRMLIHRDPSLLTRVLAWQSITDFDLCGRLQASSSS